MRGAILSIFSMICVIVFSICLFLSDNLLMFWLFLELGTLGLIPSFFLYSDSSVLSGLFSYIIISGVSSSLIISGIMFEKFLILSLIGLLVKFGVFPFIGWVYIVVVSTNWLVVWALSTFLKSGFLFFSFFLGSGWDLGLLELCCILTFFFVGVLFWLYTQSWLHYWCHVMICSSASLVVMAVEVSSDPLLFLFLIYVVWATCVIFLLSHFEELSVFGGGSYFLMIFVLVSFPGSLAIFYKLVIGMCIFSCGLVVFLSWVFYNLSEQFFLVKYLIGQGIPRSEWFGGHLV